jgi:hypothetical protein
VVDWTILSPTFLTAVVRWAGAAVTVLAVGPARAADWLCLAATPTFAIMALLTVLAGGSDTVCAAVHEASPLSGMAAMYLLMSAFHAAPWLRLISGRRSGAERS